MNNEERTNEKARKKKKKTRMGGWQHPLSPPLLVFDSVLRMANREVEVQTSVCGMRNLTLETQTLIPDAILQYTTTAPNPQAPDANGCRSEQRNVPCSWALPSGCLGHRTASPTCRGRRPQPCWQWNYGPRPPQRQLRRNRMRLMKQTMQQKQNWRRRRRRRRKLRGRWSGRSSQRRVRHKGGEARRSAWTMPDHERWTGTLQQRGQRRLNHFQQRE